MQINIQSILVGVVAILVAVVCSQQIQISNQAERVKNFDMAYAPAEFTLDYKLEDGTATTTPPIKTVTSLKAIITYLNSQIYAQQASTEKTGNANPSDTQPRPTSEQPK